MVYIFVNETHMIINLFQPPTIPISRNYTEMRDRLRLHLMKKASVHNMSHLTT